MKRHLLALRNSFITVGSVTFAILMTIGLLSLLDKTDHPLIYFSTIVFFVFLTVGYLSELN